MGGGDGRGDEVQIPDCKYILEEDDLWFLDELDERDNKAAKEKAKDNKKKGKTKKAEEDVGCKISAEAGASKKKAEKSNKKKDKTTKSPKPLKSASKILESGVKHVGGKVKEAKDCVGEKVKEAKDQAASAIQGAIKKKAVKSKDGDKGDKARKTEKTEKSKNIYKQLDDDKSDKVNKAASSASGAKKNAKSKKKEATGSAASPMLAKDSSKSPGGG